MKNIITIEDPVEVCIPGVNQIHVHRELGFPAILRSILRQDPDIIMIGEIRDEDTAKLAIQAANTGHLVLSTLHTNSCLETMNRLRHMNIQQNDLISCLRLIVSQRLLRKKCDYCAGEIKKLSCDCNDGYSGRLGLFEILSFDENLKKYMLENNQYHEDELTKYHKFHSIHSQARLCLNQGIITEEEVQRVFNIVD